MVRSSYVGFLTAPFCASTRTRTSDISLTYSLVLR
jgi:hypothetical protein